MWKLHRYNYDDPSPPPATHFPVNKGHEAMMFLSYVINNHDSLPDYSIFVHGHRKSWHQEEDIVELIENLRLQTLEQVGYISLRCDWYPSCPREMRLVDHDAVGWGQIDFREEVEMELEKAWPWLFGNDTEIPRTLSSQCCAQFALTRKAILQRPRWEYERMRQWLVDTDLDDAVSGRVLEKLWAYIFTKEPVRCPPPQQCACEFFGQCDPADWPEWAIPLDKSQKWPEEFDHYVPGSKLVTTFDFAN
jgi:hypothetical protein